MPQLPTIVVEAALTTNPAATPTWTNISAYTRGFRTRRGRQFELDRIEAGTASVILKNQDRRFDPYNTSGPYYGNLKRSRRVRLRATWSGVTYPIYAGYVEAWPQTWQAQGKYGEVPLPLSDAFSVFSLQKLNVSYSSTTSGGRINDVLDDVNWGSGQAWVLGDAIYSELGDTTVLAPVGDRAVGVGDTTVQASTLTDVTALQHMQDVNDTENGLLMIGRDGSVVFQSRSTAMRTAYRTPYTFGDGAGELQYADLTLDDQTPIWNEIRLTRTGGSVQVASDSTSQTSYWTRTYSKTGLLNTSDAEVLSSAHWRLNRYKEPGLRVSSITIMPQRDPSNLFPQVLNHEIGDTITVTRRPPGGGSVISQRSIIAGIEHSVDTDAWQTRWWLTPADPALYWLLGNSTASVLGTTTRLAY